IVSGQLMEIGDTYRMVVRVLSVETAAVAAQYRNDVRNDGRMRALLTERKHLEQESELGQQVRQKQQAPQAEVLVVAEGPVTATAVASDAGGKAGAAGGGSEKKAPAAVNPNKVYKVGDVGPAGGLIFYDKGDNIDGWRYMEVAPVEAEKKFAWWIQRHLRNVPDKGGFTAVGKGKDNTQELMKYVNENCGIYNNELPAILYCTTLEINGYKDWFLPSLDELHLMRQNLHIMGLDKFSNEERYWSSSSYRYVTFKFNENGWASAAAMGLVRPARRF
ncbi:MAG: DUF1566 domain-containing protein, partial [Chitinispirillia bacterium]|nr:DUF1566 domain-containing protein [Chitinispirillia bacterium]